MVEFSHLFMKYQKIFSKALLFYFTLKYLKIIYNLKKHFFAILYFTAIAYHIVKKPLNLTDKVTNCS